MEWWKVVGGVAGSVDIGMRSIRIMIDYGLKGEESDRRVCQIPAPRRTGL